MKSVLFSPDVVKSATFEVNSFHDHMTTVYRNMEVLFSKQKKRGSTFCEKLESYDLESTWQGIIPTNGC